MFHHHRQTLLFVRLPGSLRNKVQSRRKLPRGKRIGLISHQSSAPQLLCLAMMKLLGLVTRFHQDVVGLYGRVIKKRCGAGMSSQQSRKRQLL